MKPSLIVFFCIVHFMCVGQYKKMPGIAHNISLRGKAFIGPSLINKVEDVITFNATLGAEYFLGKRHSIGSDVIHYRHTHLQKARNNDNTENVKTGFKQFSKKTIYNLELRHYYVMHDGPTERLYYFNFFGRTGKTQLRTPDDFPLRKDDNIREDASFSDLGVGVGIRASSKYKSHVGVDINLGFGARFIHGHGLENVESFPEYYEFGTSPQVLCTFRINIFYAFKRKNPLSDAIKMK